MRVFETVHVHTHSYIIIFFNKVYMFRLVSMSLMYQILFKVTVNMIYMKVEKIMKGIYICIIYLFIFLSSTSSKKLI